MLALIVGQLLPWCFGAACIAAFWRAREPGSTTVLGYGYAVGAVALTLWMRLLSFADLGWTWITVGGPFLVGIGVAWWQLDRRSRKLVRFSAPVFDDDAAPGFSPRAAKAIWWSLIALIGLHLFLAALEISWRPLLPWDSWTQWATKARVWFELQRMVPFADDVTWFGGGTYIDAAPGYPANVPLLQAWAATTLGQ